MKGKTPGEAKINNKVSFFGQPTKKTTEADFIAAISAWTGITRDGEIFPCTEANRLWFYRRHKDLSIKAMKIINNQKAAKGAENVET